MTPDENEQWLRVLQGREPAGDEEGRKAATLREILREESRVEALDSAARIRMMNSLRARGAFAGAPPAPARTNPLAALLGWLLPPVRGHSGRYAALAAVALGLVVAPPLYRNLNQPADDATEMKRMPTLDVPVTVVTAQPEQASTQLLLLLGRSGIGAQVRAESEDRVVEARVPQDRVAELRAGLQSLGLNLPADGRLNVRFARSR